MAISRSNWARPSEEFMFLVYQIAENKDKIDSILNLMKTKMKFNLKFKVEVKN